MPYNDEGFYFEDSSVWISTQSSDYERYSDDDYTPEEGEDEDEDYNVFAWRENYRW